MNHLYQGGLRSALLCLHTPQMVSFRLARWQRALWLCALVLLVSCAESTDHPESVVATASPISAEQQRLEDFFTATWEEDLARYPASASYLGIKIGRINGTMYLSLFNWSLWKRSVNVWRF